MTKCPLTDCRVENFFGLAIQLGGKNLILSFCQGRAAEGTIPSPRIGGICSYDNLSLICVFFPLLIVRT